MAPASSCRFDELGRFQFDLLCRALIDGAEAWERDSTRGTSVLVATDGAIVPGTDRRLPGPTVVMTAWVREPGEAHRVVRLIEGVAYEWRHIRPRSLLLLTNADATPSTGGVDVEVLDGEALSQLVHARADLRLRMPSLLGVCDARPLVPGDVEASSTADLEASIALARVFVPTRAYASTREVLEQFGFAVLTGPPEMGKTAIARMIGLAKATDGWELHECVRPDQLWERFARDRPQVFVADDAFGSTEYRPDAAEHWAVELDRVLQAMDERHWLLWTSRPAPLKAGLRRIHREHGVERFPRPAEVQVDAGDLDVLEKALILFRHAKAAQLPAPAVDAVRTHGWRIVEHEHFTPERIRRFVTRLDPETLARLDAGAVEQLIVEEIREPTTAMAASFRAIGDEHRAVLVAMLDVPPGPVPERELIAAMRRHSPEGCPRQPGALLDRLSDHFVRVATNGSVTWVHPSWRDLVIEELACDAELRRAFLGTCSLDGLLLTLSTGGGSSGARSLPLLVDDRDWDAAADRLAAVAVDLDAPSATRLVLSLDGALAAAEPPTSLEVESLAGQALGVLSHRWNESGDPVSVGLLREWLGLRARLDEKPPLPNLAPTWIERLPSATADPRSAEDVADLDDWLALVQLLREHAPAQLRLFDSPARQRPLLAAFVERVIVTTDEIADRQAVIRTLQRASRLVPEIEDRARDAVISLAAAEGVAAAETYPLRPVSPELSALLDAPPAPGWSDERLVGQVLRDL